MRYIIVILVIVLSVGPPLAFQYTDIPFAFVLFLFVLGAISLGVCIVKDYYSSPLSLQDTEMTELPQIAREIGEELDKIHKDITELKKQSHPPVAIRPIVQELLKEKENANEKQNR